MFQPKQIMLKICGICTDFFNNSVEPIVKADVHHLCEQCKEDVKVALKQEIEKLIQENTQNNSLLESAHEIIGRIEKAQENQPIETNIESATDIHE